MAEAEDVITDVARHATSFAQGWWHRHRAPATGPPAICLADLLPRIELLLTAMFGAGQCLRVAQVPTRERLLSRIFRRGDRPRTQRAVPATDGTSLWLPDDAGTTDAALASARWRTMALQQAMRAQRGSAQRLKTLPTPLLRDTYLLLEAQAADEALAARFPGLVAPLQACRAAALAGRPALHRFIGLRRPLEVLLRTLLERPCGSASEGAPTPGDSATAAHHLVGEWLAGSDAWAGSQPLFKDAWTGELRAPEPGSARLSLAANPDGYHPDASPPRSARLSRRPEVRQGSDDEDDDCAGPWMIQPTPPHEHAEDPFGLQRPTDRDAQAAAEQYAESLAELDRARLVSTPGQACEVLMSDDPPAARSRQIPAAQGPGAALNYPEWDWRIASHREPGATVRTAPAVPGPQAWVDQTLETHRAMLAELRRRFELLRAQPLRLRRQLDGEDIDLEACIDGHADFRAGLPMTQTLYQSQRVHQRDLAILLLIDVSGSTDGWVSAHRRVIDVEREALLLVGVALDTLGEPFAVQAFSGHGPRSVTVWPIKRFDEPWGDEVAQRIAALEPGQYTRAGAALRHASATLMRQRARHRLLLLLSDGKPNDIDLYDGRYGVEDTRQAVAEARLQGIFPFCLTVDRGAGGYLPAMFGVGHYALLATPERLPTVLLDWIRRLVER